MNAPLLYPSPRSLTVLPGQLAVPASRTVTGFPATFDATIAMAGAQRTTGKAWCSGRVDAKAVPAAEGYQLTCEATGVSIVGHDEAGLRWGLTTLIQLLRQYGSTLPQLRIEDAPAFPTRGVMLDISRDRVPTMATLCDLVDRLSVLKLNELQLYAEHTVAYPGHEIVSRGSDPITLDELAELGAYAAARGITLDANQNCLGHWERWLKVPAYADLGECAQGIMVGGNWYVDPTTICPEDPRSLPLVCELLDHQMQACPGMQVNIGCDEPWELGAGRSKARCDAVGTKTVFTEWVAKVAKHVLSKGKRPQFWCDPHPREGDGLPTELTALVWGYDKNTDFATRLRAHRQAGRDAWVCPGSGCWNSTTGRTDTHRINMRLARDEGLAEGANGYLCTVWGDGGHRQPWVITLFALADTAQAAWGAGEYNDRSAGQAMFQQPELGVWLAKIGDLDADLRDGNAGTFTGGKGEGQKINNSTACHMDMGKNLLDRSGPGSADAWKQVITTGQALMASLPTSGDALFLRECRQGLTVALWAAQRAVYRRGDLTLEQRLIIAQEAVPLLAEHRALWLERSRYGGLEDSCVHYKRHLWWY